MEKYRIGDRVKFISDEPSLYASRYAEGHYKIEKVKYIGVIRNVHPIMKGMCLYTIETIPPLRWICLVYEEESEIWLSWDEGWKWVISSLEIIADYYGEI